MKLIGLQEKSVLNSFVAQSAGGQFLQSWEWGVFQQKMGKEIWRCGVVDNNQQILASALLVSQPLPLSRSYLYCPHGPVLAKGLSFSQKETIFKYFLSSARDITIGTKQREEIFFRLEPRIKAQEIGNFFFNLGLKKTSPIQPRDTQILELALDKKDLLQNMHHKTRYNIRLAGRQAVKVRPAESEEDFQTFWQLLQATCARDKFRSHAKEYYRQLWLLHKDNDLLDREKMTVVLLLAKKENHTLAAGLFSFFGDRAVYLHGASADKGRKFMAPYALQWQAIELAKDSGYKYFDFYGIQPQNRQTEIYDRHQRWQGITRFKKNFGGSEINYVGAWDWVYKENWYKLYQLYKKFR